ncbi:MAG TPA: S8 family serine peptidase [Pyrinomonadaceae bacterium]|nr:S8 family serine peptidase [Pyrinomonadaceae bacterium]
MKSIRPCLIFLAAFTLALCALVQPAARASRAAAAAPQEPARFGPRPKFMKARDAIPNTYIVVLDDAAVPPPGKLSEARARVAAIAGRFAQEHGGRVGFVYEAALRGFSVELPNEEAAVAISRSPLVAYVEEAATIPLAADQFNPGWALDRIDQEDGFNNVYTYNATGAGVAVYIIDSGIRTTHRDFGGRAFIQADFIGSRDAGCSRTSTNNDCNGHGTAVASIVGGSRYGVAKGAILRSLKACYHVPFTGRGECDNTAIIAAINRVTQDKRNNPGFSMVANMSLGGDQQNTDPGGSVNAAVRNSIAEGVTYSVSAGNESDDARFYTPANVSEALTVAANWRFDDPAYFTNYGSVVDIFAPGLEVLAAGRESDTQEILFAGTSAAAPFVAGAAALYLQGRPSRSACWATPVAGPANTFGNAVSTCPDRVAQFIKSNATLDQLTHVQNDDRFGNPITAANRMLFTGSLPTSANPIENHRFFVWQQYADHFGREPENHGLRAWTSVIEGCAGEPSCVFNRRTVTAHGIITSPEFRSRHPALQHPGTPEYNDEFVRQCYRVYLRREADPDGFRAWRDYLASTGDELTVVQGFIYANEYVRRFGQP